MLLFYIVLCCYWNILYCVNLDDDLEIDVPEVYSKPVAHPKIGKDFDVTIKIQEPYDILIADKTSEPYNTLRNRIQMGVLQLYADNDFYQGLHVLNVSNSTSMHVRFFVRFTKEGNDHLGPLNQALMTGQLGDIPVANFFVNATLANYTVIQKLLCGIECASLETCGSNGCARDCCDVAQEIPIIPTATKQSLEFPMTTPDRLVSPFNQPTPRQYENPVYGSPQHYQDNSGPSLCGNNCSNFCYPLCLPSCCESLQRSSIPNLANKRFVLPYYYPRF